MIGHLCRVRNWSQARRAKFVDAYLSDVSSACRPDEGWTFDVDVTEEEEDLERSTRKSLTIRLDRKAAKRLAEQLLAALDRSEGKNPNEET